MCHILHNNMTAKQCTVIDSEIEYFNKYSADWWNTYLRLEKQNILRVPEIINSLVETGRISRATAQSETPLTGIKILDVGCGGGFTTERLAKLGAHVTGIDPSEKLIECAKTHIQDQHDIRDKVHYVHVTVEEFAEQHTDEYDHVVAAEILDHVQARDVFVQSCVRALKPGGTIFVSTINRTVKAWLQMVLYYEYINKSIPKGAHHWSLLITPDESKLLLENANCALLKFTGWTPDANGDWYPSDDTSVYYYILAMKKY